MKTDQPESIVSRMVGACFTILLAAMALYGAVQIIASVWVPLCIGAAAIAGLIGTYYLIRYRRGF